MTIKRIALFCCFAGLAVPADQPVDAPVIRVNTRLVEVDAVVRDKKGPVGDLTKDDFTITDNGKTQKIAVFSVKKSVRTSKKALTPLPEGVVSNRINSFGEEPEAATVVLWDALNTDVADQAYVRKEILKYLHNVKPGDPVALYSMAKTIKIIQDFTADPERLIRAVTKTGPEQSVNLQALDLTDLTSSIGAQVSAAAEAQSIATATAAEMEDYELRDRAYLTEACLEAIATHLAGLPGRKKLIWVTGSFPAITRDTRSRQGSTQIEVQDFGPQITKAVHKLNNANVAVYPIDPRGLVTGATMAKSPDPNTAPAFGLSISGIDTMNLVAGGTGGKASYGGNDIVEALKTAFEDDDVTYTLGFYSNDAKMDGAYHDISVKVRRSGMDVRARRGYLGLDSKLITEGHWREALDESMRNPLEATALGVRASAVPIAGAPGSYDLSVTMDTSDIHFDRVKDRWVAQVSYATRFSPSDTTKGTIETIQIALTEAKLKEALKNGFTFRRTMDAGDLKGELRVMVEDRTTGALGSVSVPIGKAAAN